LTFSWVYPAMLMHDNIGSEEHTSEGLGHGREIICRHQAGPPPLDFKGASRMAHTDAFSRIEMVYLAGVLNAVAVAALLVSSDAVSSRFHQAFIGSIGWFGIGVLFSGATIILYHFTRYYFGEGREGDLVRTATPVASAMSFLLLILGIWECAPVIRSLG